ncbi:type II toxin-antitoxin system RelE/ParE family toxin [Castellaniella caeni]|uniref:type II toxin-antitoxin system RelE/ParE family toxin n=1 Tax=Castellaniella caeni TaxID=266123 RepID=UPI0009FFF015|nr:type II toxin-antitoxin system RelE/ParE family toxin [Castellaniella caeni]
MRLEFSPRAILDLETIGDYIAQDSPPQSVRFIAQLRGQCQKIVASPKGYRLRPECGPQVRSCAHGHYVIYFTIEAKTVRIVRILHGAMDAGSRFGDTKPQPSGDIQ